MKKLHKKIASKKKKRKKKKRQKEKRSNKKKNLKREDQREIMKEKSNENHLPKVVGIHEHLLKKESGVKVIPLDSSNGRWDFQSARILKMSTSIRHNVHSKKRTVRMDIVCKTPLPILATVLYI